MFVPGEKHFVLLVVPLKRQDTGTCGLDRV